MGVFFWGFGLWWKGGEGEGIEAFLSLFFSVMFGVLLFPFPSTICPARAAPIAHRTTNQLTRPTEQLLPTLHHLLGPRLQHRLPEEQRGDGATVREGTGGGGGEERVEW